MAGALKQTFIEAVRLTPDGIQDFLETPIPTPPEISTPADVDAAIIASGVLSKYLLDVFTVFAGLTPVELLLRIGQHNSVLESAMLAGLEYLEGSDSGEQDLIIESPEDGVAYAPGEMRFFCTVRNGNAIYVIMELDGSEAKMFSVADGWQQYADVATGDHTVTMTASFEDGSEATATVNFSVANAGEEPPPGEEPPEPPGGDDLEAIRRALDNVRSTYKNLIRSAAETNEIDIVIYFNAFKNAVNTFLSVTGRTSDTITADLTRLTLAVASFDYNDVKTISSAIMTAINTLYTEITG
jgi:hypothetical protein